MVILSINFSKLLLRNETAISHSILLEYPRVIGASPSFRGHTVKNSFGRGRSINRTYGRQFVPLSCRDWS